MFAKVKAISLPLISVPVVGIAPVEHPQQNQLQTAWMICCAVLVSTDPPEVSAAKEPFARQTLTRRLCVPLAIIAAALEMHSRTGHAMQVISALQDRLSRIRQKGCARLVRIVWLVLPNQSPAQRDTTQTRKVLQITAHHKMLSTDAPFATLESTALHLAQPQPMAIVMPDTFARRDPHRRPPQGKNVQSATIAMPVLQWRRRAWQAPSKLPSDKQAALNAL
jgi:hypothetical protein